MELLNQHCVPCEGGVPPMAEEEAQQYLNEVRGWTLDGNTITKKFVFPDFPGAMKFVNQVAAIAQEQDHHPDIAISYNKVTLTLQTHAIHGLSSNDFIVAAKVDEIQ